MSEQTPTNLSNADFTFKDKYGNTGKTKGVSADDSTKLNNMVKLMNLILNTPNSTDFINTLATKQYVDSETNKAKKEIQVDIDEVATDLNGKADKDFTSIGNTAKIAIAHNAMPSNVYDDLTLGASGSAYIAPADGYFMLGKVTAVVGEYIVLANVTNILNFTSISPITYGDLRGFVPASKGDRIVVEYTASGSVTHFRFIYLNGSESEQ